MVYPVYDSDYCFNHLFSCSLSLSAAVDTGHWVCRLGLGNALREGSFIHMA